MFVVVGIPVFRRAPIPRDDDTQASSEREASRAPASLLVAVAQVRACSARPCPRAASPSLRRSSRQLKAATNHRLHRGDTRPAVRIRSVPYIHKNTRLSLHVIDYHTRQGRPCSSKDSQLIAKCVRRHVKQGDILRCQRCRAVRPRVSLLVAGTRWLLEGTATYTQSPRCRREPGVGFTIAGFRHYN